jgi:hypothetical protein
MRRLENRGPVGDLRADSKDNDVGSLDDLKELQPRGVLGMARFKNFPFLLEAKLRSRACPTARGK